MQTARAWTEGQKIAEYNGALLDNGSQRSFIVADLSRRLGCKIIRKEKLTIGSLGGFETERMINVVEVTL